MFTSVRVFPFLSTFDCGCLCSFREIICLSEMTSKNAKINDAI